MNVNLGSDGYYGSALGHATDGYYSSGQLGSDVTAPVITAISPTPATDPGAIGGFSAVFPVATDTPIVVTVTDDVGLALVSVTVDTVDASGLAAYSAGAILGAFAASSSQTAIGGGFSLSLLVDGGWPSLIGVNGFVVLHVAAVDSSGNIATATFVYRLPPSAVVIAPLEAVEVGALDHVHDAIDLLPEQFRSHDEDTP